MIRKPRKRPPSERNRQSPPPVPPPEFEPSNFMGTLFAFLVTFLFLVRGSEERTLAEWEQTKDPHQLPHPLFHFALPTFRRNAYADILLDCIKETVFSEPDSVNHKVARWLLLESEAYFFACERCGIDGKNLRNHLLNVEGRKLRNQIAEEESGGRSSGRIRKFGW